MADLRMIRKQLGLTQTEFADELGLNQSSISRFETGELATDRRTMLAAEALLAKRSDETVADGDEQRSVICLSCDEPVDGQQAAGCVRGDCPRLDREAA